MESYEVDDDSLSDEDLEEISDILKSVSDPNGGELRIPSKPNLGARAAAAVAAARMDMAKDNNDEYERWLRIKLNLDENVHLKEDNEILKEYNDNLKQGNQNLKDKLEAAEKELQNRASKITQLLDKVKSLEEDLNSEKGRVTLHLRDLNKMKGFTKKLYSAGGDVLEELGGSVIPFRDIEEGEQFAQTMEQFCGELQTKFGEWQGNHQLMHNELEKTLKIVEGLAEQADHINLAADDDPADLNGNIGVTFQNGGDTASEYLPGRRRGIPARPIINGNAHQSSSATAAISNPPDYLESDAKLAWELSRHNPLRKCRLTSSNSYDGNTAAWDHLSENSQFACQYCGDAFCRLANVHSQLARLQNNQNGAVVASEGPKAIGKPKTKAKNGARKYTKRARRSQSASNGLGHDEPGNVETNNNGVEGDANGDPGQSLVRSKLVVVDGSGQVHKFVGASTSILSPEERRAYKEGTTPLGRRRYFCKCGNHYVNWTSLYRHIKSIDCGNSIKCELCDQEFQIHNALKGHMKAAHGKDYIQKRFPCLECGKRFTTKKQVEAHRTIEHGGMDMDDDVDSGDSGDTLLLNN